MADIKLTYFDFDGGRGEEARLALHIAGVDFEDDRIQAGTWGKRKPGTPFGSAPVLEIAGRGRLAQSSAILGFIGRAHGLHPSDAFEAARHEALMSYAEELRERLAPMLSVKKPKKRRKARKKIATEVLPQWAANVEAEIVGPFVGGEAIRVVDLKLFVLLGFVLRGGIDDVPADTFEPFERLMGVHAAVAAHPRVIDWYERRAKAKG